MVIIELVLSLTIHDMYTVKQILSKILNIIARLEKEMLKSKIGQKKVQ